MGEILVIFSSLFSLFAVFSYIKDTLKGKTKPNRISWFLWAVAPIIGSAAAFSTGITWVTLPVFMAGFNPLLVFIASWMNPKSYWKLEKSDYVCGVFSVLALLLWGITKNADIAIILAILSDAFAGIPTILKSWKDPASENALPYISGIIGSIASFISFKHYNFTEIAFPIYLLILNVIIVSLLIVASKKTQKTDRSSES